MRLVFEIEQLHVVDYNPKEGRSRISGKAKVKMENRPTHMIREG